MKTANKAKGGKKPAVKAPKPAMAKVSKSSAKVKKPAIKKQQTPKAAVKPVKAVKELKKPAPVKVAKVAPVKVKAVKAAPQEQPVKKIRPLNDPFLKKQKERLLQLKDTLLDSMSGVARDSLRTESNEASAFGMHQADAGSDAYDRDFALSLISQEQDALYEIDEALKRVDNGTYGTCEISGKHVPRARLEALPFTRYTVECQAELEKTNRYRRLRQPVASLFGNGDDESGDDDDDSTPDSKE
ncbi:MAG: TraR/DksA C4-type zinc finger protein [Chthoniobacterales bacterium]